MHRVWFLSKALKQFVVLSLSLVHTHAFGFPKK